MQGIEIIARAFISRDDEILLAHAKEEKNTFLPGGHVNFGEFTKTALKRELEEELGVETEILEFLGVLECTYVSVTNKNEIHHEINLIFKVKIKGGIPCESGMKSKERKLEFLWVKIDELDKLNLLPKSLTELIPRWAKEKKTFFKSAFAKF